MRAVLLLLVGCLNFQLLNSQAGTIDSSWANNGFKFVDIDGAEDEQEKIEVLSNGKIIACGTTSDFPNPAQIYVYRFNPDGTIDSTFGTNGKYLSSFGQDTYCRDIAIDSSTGDIFVCGINDFNSFSNRRGVTVKLLANGQVDNSFGSNGIVIINVGSIPTTAESIVLQPDGKAIVAGSQLPLIYKDFLVARIQVNGLLDSSFGQNGISIVSYGGDALANSVELLSSGKIILGGYATDASGFQSFALARLLPGGTLDAGFSGGTVFIPFGTSSSIEEIYPLNSDEFYAIGDEIGTFYTCALLKFNSNGSLDRSFGDTGIFLLPSDSNDYQRGEDISIQADGKVLIALRGSRSFIMPFIVARINPAGLMDLSFGNNGYKLITYPMGDNRAKSVRQLPDGRILVGGSGSSGISSDLALIMLNGVSTGVANLPSFEDFRIYPNPSSSGSFTLSGGGDQVKIELISFDGHVVSTQTYSNQDAIQIRIPANLSSNALLVRSTNLRTGQAVTKKLIVHN